MNYKVIKVDDQYSVLEVTTGQFVFSHKNKEEARKMMKHMNLGGGFDGWSPAFILNGRKK